MAKDIVLHDACFLIFGSIPEAVESPGAVVSHES